MRARARWRASRGQIATFLLLGIVALLIFAMMTANLGSVSLTSASTSNASDAAALFLASQCATKSHALWESLGFKTKKCKKGGGFLGIFLAIILAIILIVIVVVTWQYWALAALPSIMSLGTAMIIAGAVGGAIGGAIGGGITGGWNGALMGAIQGAMIGAAIGGIAAGGMTLYTAAPGSGTAMTGAEILFTEDAVFGGSTIASVSAGGSVPLSATVLSGIVVPTQMLAAGSIASGAFSVGSSIYNQTIADMASADAIASVSKALNGMPETWRIQQATIFEALVRSVTDPTEDVDTTDLDGDGNTTETVPHFLIWWEDRINQIKSVMDPVGVMLNLINEFVTFPVQQFVDDSFAFKQEQLSRQEIEGADGELVDLARRLEVPAVRTDTPSTSPYPNTTDYSLQFWEPGPSQAELDAWLCTSCAVDPDPNAPLPPGFDEVDQTILKLDEIKDSALGLGANDPATGAPVIDPNTGEPVQIDPQNRFDARGDWMPWFYDPADIRDYYDNLDALVNGGKDDGEAFKGMKSWEQQLKTVRDTLLPGCALFYTPTPNDVVFDNAPCKVDTARQVEVNQAVIELNEYLANADAIAAGAAPIPAECDGNISVSANVTTLALHHGVIDYDFTYSGSCTHRECHWVDGGCDTSVPPNCYDPVEVCIDIPISFGGDSSSTYAVPSGAPGMRIDSPPRSKAEFASGVDAWEGFVTGLDLSAQPFGSSDADTDDEFVPVLAAVEDFIQNVAEPFRPAIKDFADAMAVQEALLINTPPPVPVNPVTYTWTDTHGTHDVTAEVGPFILASTKKTESGFFIKEICIKLRDYSDDGSRTWVKLTRQDPAGQEMGLWQWSPIPLTTTRMSRAAYSFDFVNLSGTK